MKHTGDIHPPEVESALDDFAGEDAAVPDAALRSEAPGGRTSAMSTPATMALPAPEPMPRGLGEDAREQVRRHPLATLSAAFALGVVLARLFR